MKRIIYQDLALAVISFGLFTIALGQLQDAQRDNLQAKHELVYQVCNNSRISPVINEKKCVELQDQTHTEFLCAQANMNTDNYCWVEDL